MNEMISSEGGKRGGNIDGSEGESFEAARARFLAMSGGDASTKGESKSNFEDTATVIETPAERDRVRRESEAKERVRLEEELQPGAIRLYADMDPVDLVAEVEQIISKSNLAQFQDNPVGLRAAYIEATNCLQMAVDKTAKEHNATNIIAGLELPQQIALISEYDGSIGQNVIAGTYELVEKLGEEIRRGTKKI